MSTHKRHGHELPNPKRKRTRAKQPDVKLPWAAHFNRDGSPKIVFLTESSALSAAQRNMDSETGRSWHAYKCGECGCWHLSTSRPKAAVSIPSDPDA
jgi:hypothetical protein